MTDALAVAGLDVVRGARVLLRDLSFRVPAGGALLVRGANGVGKSSLLRILAGLGRAAGSIDRPDRVALTAEATALDRDRTLRDALLFWAQLDAMPNAATRVATALADVALDGLADVPVRLLSNGQSRRAAFARVVAAGATLWLLDEPANGLDAAAVARLEALVARHRATGGIAVVATHQPLALPDAAILDLDGAA